MTSIDRPPALQPPVSLLKRTDAERYAAVLSLAGSQLVSDLNADYAYWDDVKNRVPESIQPFVTPQDLWSIVKYSRRAGQRTLSIAAERFVFTATDTLYGQLHRFDQPVGGAADGLGTLADADKSRYQLSALMEEAIASSQLDGATTARDMAKDMLRKQRPPRDPSERMIANTYATIQHVTATAQRPLTPDSLLNMHRLLTANLLAQATDSGAFRQSDAVDMVDAVTGNFIRKPPACATLPAFVTELCRFYNDETPDYFLHPVVKASLIHFLIGYFHPFAESNGRVARALFYGYLLKRGYWQMAYLSISRVIGQTRGTYYETYRYADADDNDVGYFVRYQVTTLHQALDALNAYIERKATEKQQSNQWQRTGNISARQATILGWLHAEPSRILSVKEVETLLGTSNQTARTDLQGLVDSGYLTEVRINQKEKQFALGTHPQ